MLVIHSYNIVCVFYFVSFFCFVYSTKNVPFRISNSLFLICYTFCVLYSAAANCCEWVSMENNVSSIIIINILMYI